MSKLRFLKAFVLMALAPISLQATELAPFLKEQRIGVVIGSIKLPVTLPKDLSSGLSNRILVRVSILSESKLIDQKTIDVAIKYDLWEERFGLTAVVDGVATITTNYAKVEDVMAFLSNLRLSGLFPSSEVARQTYLVLQVDLLVNPIERERMEAIKKWVAKNSTYTSSGEDAFGAGKRIAASSSNTLFNKIFDQYSAGGDMAAAWKETVSSKPFKLEDLGDAR
jgi:hypothetical protein